MPQWLLDGRMSAPTVEEVEEVRQYFILKQRETERRAAHQAASAQIQQARGRGAGGRRRGRGQ